MSRSVIVLGAGIIGVSVAVHLRRRGLDVALVDRQGPGEGASFGNSGLIQREKVFPIGFPRSVAQLQRIARNRSTDAVYHPQALPGLAGPLLRYWWHAEPERHRRAMHGHSRLIATCLDEHLALARDAGATDLLRPTGYHRLYGDAKVFAAGLAEAEVARREHGVNSVALSADELAAAEPDLAPGKVGGIHWTDTYSVSDPHGLTSAYARLLAASGGTVAIGDAATLERAASRWRLQAADGPVEASEIVVALGPSSSKVTRLMVGLAMPASSRVWKASAGEPFLGLVLDLEVGALREILGQLNEPPRPTGGAGRGVFVLDVEPPLAECLCRLVRMLDTPRAFPVLYPLIAREICYWLLIGPHGSRVRAAAFPEGRMQGVAQAVAIVRQRFDGPITVPELARTAGMGLSTFHQHFKALTGLSPIQYQKQLRLDEGRRLVVEDGINVETAALRVGYESVPQFSRDYARLFGASPRKDTGAIRAAV